MYYGIGTLTENKMTVVSGYVGGIWHDTVPDVASMHSNVTHLISRGISLNSTASIVPSTSGGQPQIIGSVTVSVVCVYGYWPVTVWL